MGDETLGLAIGTTNLTAVRPGREPVSRRAVLTLWEGHPAEVGIPSRNPELTSPNLVAPGVVLRGFVERVGDPVPLVAQDGSTHRGEILTATALDAMARTAGDGQPTGTVVVAVPAHWGPATVGALRGALRGFPTLSPGGAAPLIVSDATAALAALRSDPGLPDRGVVAVCDFGASGTSITLADAGSDFTTIGETVRYGDFSGDHADRALLNDILSGVRADASETAGTAAVGSLTRLREECRLAKERLSAETSTVVQANLPGFDAEVRVTRAELENLLSAPFAGFLDALGDALERSRIPATSLSAVVAVGGGAAIPFVTQRISEQLRVPVITAAQPGLTAARGAAVIASTGADPQAKTGLAVTAADAPTSLAPSAWAVGTAGRAATESASDGSPSATFRALAWSQDDPAADEPVPY
ncbi:MAG: Hsp70 family protein, partial [Mycobacterium sp.]|nr:Hsp70 family protein [Mycobacterium sp.]